MAKGEGQEEETKA